MRQIASPEEEKEARIGGAIVHTAGVHLALQAPAGPPASHHISDALRRRHLKTMQLSDLYVRENVFRCRRKTLTLGVIVYLHVMTQ